jgi:hypothetical protein
MVNGKELVIVGKQKELDLGLPYLIVRFYISEDE